MLNEFIMDNPPAPPPSAGSKPANTSSQPMKLLSVNQGSAAPTVISLRPIDNPEADMHTLNDGELSLRARKASLSERMTGAMKSLVSNKSSGDTIRGSSHDEDDCGGAKSAKYGEIRPKSDLDNWLESEDPEPDEELAPSSGSKKGFLKKALSRLSMGSDGAGEGRPSVSGCERSVLVGRGKTPPNAEVPRR
jgi:hypothetical protein